MSIITTKSRGRQSRYSWHRCNLCRRASGMYAADGVWRSCGFSSRRNTPSNFIGMQYLDSKGCAFIRFGFGGSTRWVTRLTRQRRQVCVLPPSMSASERTQVAVSQAPDSVKPIKITFDDPVVAPMTRAAAPKPRAQEGASLGTALASLFRPKRQAQPVLCAAPEPMRTTGTDHIRV